MAKLIFIINILIGAKQYRRMEVSKQIQAMFFRAGRAFADFLCKIILRGLTTPMQACPGSGFSLSLQRCNAIFLAGRFYSAVKVQND
jgi:hypothetical protein